MNIITTESLKCTLEIEKFTEKYERLYPDVAKTIRGRRAEFYLLINTSKFVGNMFHHGQIESKDLKQLQEEIDDKVYKMKRVHARGKVVSDHENVLI